MITSPQMIQFISELSTFCSENLNLDTIVVNTKADLSPVTAIDLAISQFCKNHPLSKENFYSEEDHGELTFPSIILDPIDGTKELIKRNVECAVSIAWMKSSTVGEGLIFNPFTGFHLSTFDRPAWESKSVESPYLGYVSRNEIHSFEIYKKSPFQIIPRGSIAFKLGLLSAGSCDFVVSLKPKNIWDIAAGTLLTWQRGMHFYSNGKIVTQLDQSSYSPPLVWSKKQIAFEVNSYFFSHKGTDQ